MPTTILPDGRTLIDNQLPALLDAAMARARRDGVAIVRFEVNPDDYDTLIRGMGASTRRGPHSPLEATAVLWMDVPVLPKATVGPGVVEVMEKQ